MEAVEEAMGVFTWLGDSWVVSFLESAEGAHTLMECPTQNVHSSVPVVGVQI